MPRSGPAPESDRPESDRPESAQSGSAQAILLEELHVHQSELEAQNDELRRLRSVAEVHRDRYLALFANAPVGYCVLDESGCVLESNLAARSMLASVDSWKHARHVAIELRVAGRLLVLGIRDDGRGFDPGIAPAGFGLASLREQTRLLGGTFDLQTSIYHGTEISIVLPLSVRTSDSAVAT